MLRSYKNIPIGKVQLNFKIYDKTEGGTSVWESVKQWPKGYLLCNGRQLGKTQYLDLFTAIDTTYGGEWIY
jgi:hypothetical protein